MSHSFGQPQERELPTLLPRALTEYTGFKLHKNAMNQFIVDDYQVGGSIDHKQRFRDLRAQSLVDEFRDRVEADFESDFPEFACVDHVGDGFRSLLAKIRVSPADDYRQAEFMHLFAERKPKKSHWSIWLSIHKDEHDPLLGLHDDGRFVSLPNNAIFCNFVNFPDACSVQ